tara:strand:- start:1469 stop:1960 length:492 start_codon:yes stop_codon:yes gene_type:complete
MIASNQLTMTGVDGKSVYSFADDGELYTHRIRKLPSGEPREEHGIVIETKLPALQGGDDYDSECVISLSWVDAHFDSESILQKLIEIPNSYDESIADHVTNLYYYEHLGFDNVRLRFVDRDDDRFRIELTGACDDPNNGPDGRLDIHVDTVVRLRRVSAEQTG